MCGEKCSNLFCNSLRSGSPPRVWGKVQNALTIMRKLRITPTCVGKRQQKKRNLTLTGDHPHVCGEKCTVHLPVPGTKGSPPRVWGKEDVLRRRKRYGGITPTCVGKRSITSRAPVQHRDHPHVCGEKRL